MLSFSASEEGYFCCMISTLAIIYAFDALNSCKQRLTNEKIVDTTFSALNSAMDFVIEIANISSLKSS